MSVEKKIYDKMIQFFENMWDKIYRLLLKIVEVKKFQDSRRKEIYSQVVLSKTDKDMIDKLYIENYGKRIPYIWHRHYTAFTRKFDYKYFPELLFIPEFEYFMNSNSSYTEVFMDKNVIPMLANIMKVEMPRTIISVIKGVYHDEAYNVLSKDEAMQRLKNKGEFFIKPSTNSCSGINCRKVNVQNGTDLLSGDILSEILDKLGKDICVQECIKCHDSISRIYPKSVNTFRVITYRWKEKIISLPIVMRIGSGGRYLDNAHAGGMFIAVSDDGFLHECAYTEFKEEYRVHPDTKVEFLNCKVEMVPEVINAAKKLHGALTQVGVINWDFTVNEQGQPVLIEGNMKQGGIWLIEMAHGIGPFGDNTEEVLRWLNLMKKTPKSKRGAYQFGEGV